MIPFLFPFSRGLLFSFSTLDKITQFCTGGVSQQAGNAPPPTPSQMTGTSTSFDSEERGDLILFYNQVYVQKMKAFALKFRAAQEVQYHYSLVNLPLKVYFLYPVFVTFVSISNFNETSKIYIHVQTEVIR